MHTRFHDYDSGNTARHALAGPALVALLMFAAHAPTFAASLFGDHSCKDWMTLEAATKKTWTNAFLAPLSMAHEDRRKTGTDKYNDDPYAADAAIKGIDRYCEAHPEGGAADGAGDYLSSLVSGR
ncbi:MAG: hypothetical protein RL404_1166 [Pseudomonadota bacterium]|jgi:hypothetical protein